MGLSILKDLDKDKKIQIQKTLTDRDYLAHFSEDPFSGKFVYAIRNRFNNTYIAYFNDGQEQIGNEKIKISDIYNFENYFFKGNSYSIVESGEMKFGHFNGKIFENGVEIPLDDKIFFHEIQFSETGFVNISYYTSVAGTNRNYSTMVFKAGEGKDKNTIFIKKDMKIIDGWSGIQEKTLRGKIFPQIITIKLHTDDSAIEVYKDGELIKGLSDFITSTNKKLYNGVSAFRGHDGKLYFELSEYEYGKQGTVKYVYDEDFNLKGSFDDLYEKIACVSKTGELWTEITEGTPNLKISGKEVFSKARSKRGQHFSKKITDVTAEIVDKRTVIFHNPKINKSLKFTHENGEMYKYDIDESDNIFFIIETCNKQSGKFDGNFLVYKNSDIIFNSKKVFSEEISNGCPPILTDFEVDSKGNASITIKNTIKELGKSDLYFEHTVKVSPKGSFTFELKDGKKVFGRPGKIKEVVSFDKKSPSDSLMIEGQIFKKRLLSNKGITIK